MKEMRKADYRFRVSCKLKYTERQAMREFEFHYANLELARENYKVILLSLYKNRSVLTFSICLNRSRDAHWINAIYQEKVLNA